MIVRLAPILLVAGGALVGCGAINAYTGAALTSAGESYQGARSNLQTKNDLLLHAWADGACAMPVGALSRSGDPAILRAVLAACPVPGILVLPEAPK